MLQLEKTIGIQIFFFFTSHNSEKKNVRNERLTIAGEKSELRNKCRN